MASWATQIGILLACLAAVAGCGDGRPKRVPVSGQVLLNGKPLPAGFVRVVPKAGRAALGTISPDGRFTLETFEKDDGCILGTHAVEIISGGGMGDEFQASATRGKVNARLVPERYANHGTSGLKVTIDRPIQDWVIELQSK